MARCGEICAKITIPCLGLCLFCLYSIEHFPKEQPIYGDVITSAKNRTGSDKVHFAQYIYDQELVSHSFRTYETSAQCTVTLSTAGRPVDDASRSEKRTARQESCTLRHFDGHFADTGQYCGDGTWSVRSDDKEPTERDVEFIPEICSFPPRKTSLGMLKKCFQKRNVQTILVTGDSTGRYQKWGVMDVLKAAGYSCQPDRVAKREDTKTGTSYFDVPTVPHKRLRLTGCGFVDIVCSSDLYKCSAVRDSSQPGRNHTIYLEYIAMFHILDESVTISYNQKGEFESRALNAETTVEYLLKYYFPHHGFPDIWVFCLPFHHETWGSSLEKIQLNTIYVLTLLQMHLPNSTEIFFLSDAAECPNKRPSEVALHFETFWNITRNERIHEMNQVFYSILLSVFSTFTNYHAFLDATRLSCPVICDWHLDGAHMQPFWYFKMAEYLFDMICVN